MRRKEKNVCVGPMTKAATAKTCVVRDVRLFAMSHKLTAWRTFFTSDGL